MSEVDQVVKPAPRKRRAASRTKPVRVVERVWQYQPDTGVMALVEVAG